MNEGRETVEQYEERGGVVTVLDPVELELDAALERARAKRGTESGRRHPGRPIGAKFPNSPRNQPKGKP